MTDWRSNLVAAAEAAGLHAEVDGDLGGLTTYRVGGRASVLLSVRRGEEIGALSHLLSVPEVTTVGQGSNTLVADSGYAGIALLLGSGDSASLAEDEMVLRRGDDGRMRLTVGAAARLPVVARRVAAGGICGAEWMVGVPGSVGGAVCMNAGGHGADMASMLESAEVMDLRTGRSATVSARDLGLRFRGSALAGHHLVLSCTLVLGETPSHGGSCQDRLAEIVAWRREHQPGGQNAGSVFVNPGEGERSAGAMIDACGLRGRSIGTASVSDKHANFIQAEPGGLAADVLALMCLVQDEVAARFGTVLRSEIRLIGFDAAVVGRFTVHRHYAIDDAEIRAAAARLGSLI